MTLYPCAYLGGEVELSRERAAHIAERHPDLLPGHAVRIAEVLADPDQVRRSGRFGNARLFSRSYPADTRGRDVVVVVVSDVEPMGRHWVITAYQARKLSGGEVEWMRG